MRSQLMRGGYMGNCTDVSPGCDDTAPDRSVEIEIAAIELRLELKWTAVLESAYLYLGCDPPIVSVLVNRHSIEFDALYWILPACPSRSIFYLAMCWAARLLICGKDPSALGHLCDAKPLRS